MRGAGTAAAPRGSPDATANRRRRSLSRSHIATEPTKDNPYRNFIAVKSGEQNEPWVRTLVASYENDDIKSALLKVYHGTAVPGW